MMVFPANMNPKALIQNDNKSKSFTCNFCGDISNGFIVNPGNNREKWAVLPVDWLEVEDRQPYAKKQFLICCQKSECQHEANIRSK
jgi:hypothetical protein